MGKVRKTRLQVGGNLRQGPGGSCENTAITQYPDVLFCMKPRLENHAMGILCAPAAPHD